MIRAIPGIIRGQSHKAGIRILRLQAEYENIGKPKSLYFRKSTDESDKDVGLLERIRNLQMKSPEQIYMEKGSPEEIYHALSVIFSRESTCLFYRYGSASMMNATELKQRSAFI